MPIPSYQNGCIRADCYIGCTEPVRLWRDGNELRTLVGADVRPLREQVGAVAPRIHAQPLPAWSSNLLHLLAAAR
jgi:hypothetical protein